MGLPMRQKCRRLERILQQSRDRLRVGNPESQRQIVQNSKSELTKSTGIPYHRHGDCRSFAHQEPLLLQGQMREEITTR